MVSPTSAPTLNRRTAVRLGSGGLAAALIAREMRSAGAQPRSTLEANKALAHRVFAEAVNGGNAAAIGELYAPDFVDRGAWARQMPGPAGLPLIVDEFHALYPDVYVTVEDAIAEGDFVATRETWRGVHPQAGTHVVGRTMHVFRIVNGQIVEEWSAGWEWLAERGGSSAPRPRNPLART